MLFYALKTLVSALMIVTIAEIAKRSSFVGGWLASLPLVSVLALIWLYLDTKDTEKISSLAISIFWMVLPSLSLFLILPVLLKKQVPFYGALTLSCVATGLVYYGATVLYGKLGIKL